MSTSQTITDTLLIKAINHASNRVVIITPGVWPPLAHALANAWQRLGPERVTVIVDVDPEVCRIGYGSLKSEVANFAKRVEAKLSDRFRLTAEQLTRELLDDVLNILPVEEFSAAKERYL